MLQDEPVGKPERRHRSNNLDLMRLALAALVLLGHSPELLDGDRSREPLTWLFHTISFGELAVDAFFILSGFVITMSWDRQPKVGRFLLNRTLRIYPAFIVAFLLSVLVAGALGAASVRSYLSAVSPGRMLKQIAFLQRPTSPPTFAGGHHNDVNGAMWTIQYEFACYLAVVALGVCGVLRKRGAVMGLWVGCLLVFIAFRIHHAGDATTGAIMSRTGSVIRFAMLYLSGIVAYVFRIHERRSMAALLAAAALLVLGLTNSVAAEPAIATAGAYLLFFVGFTPLEHAYIRAIPDVSYGLYLYGWPVQKVLISRGKLSSPVSLFVVSLIVALILGYFSYVLIEKPALKLKARSRASTTPRPAGLAAPGAD